MWSLNAVQGWKYSRIPLLKFLYMSLKRAICGLSLSLQIETEAEDVNGEVMSKHWNPSWDYMKYTPMSETMGDQIKEKRTKRQQKKIEYCKGAMKKMIIDLGSKESDVHIIKSKQGVVFKDCYDAIIVGSGAGMSSTS